MTDQRSAFATGEAPAALLGELHAMCVRAFEGDFDPEDWDHALGGKHFVAYEADRPVAHAAVVERTLRVGDRPVRVGYVEAVATEPDSQGSGRGTEVMTAAGQWIRQEYELGLLATGEFHFYERLGWERWLGPTFVIDGQQLLRSPDADGAVMALRVGSGTLDLMLPIACESRPGDDW
jgi:aminoglycoside 2'-N-acetyltransferase I